METQTNHNIFDMVSNYIVKWYDDTLTAIKISIKDRRGVDIELIGILLLARKQTLGALTTYANRHIIPTYALLRILVEIYIFLTWALNVDDIGKERKADEVYKRFRRWDYTRLKKDRDLLKELPQNEQIESQIQQMESQIEDLKKGGLKELPPTKQLCGKLGKEWIELYARLFRKYSRAVHPNRNTTQNLAWIEEEPKSVLMYKDDVSPHGKELLELVAVSSDINKQIRDFYGWHSKEIQNQYEDIKSELVLK